MNETIFEIADKWAELYPQPARKVKSHPEWKQEALEYLKQFNISESNFKDNSELYWFIKNRRTSFPICPVTGKRTKYRDHGEYYQYCGNVGSKDPNYIQKRKQSLLDKYGTTCSLNTIQAKEKTKKTLLEKYGTENYNHTPEAREKAKQTMISRYGVEHALLSPEIKEKRKQTNLERYDVDEIGKSKILQNQARQTCLERYGVEYAIQNKDIQNKIKKSYKEKYGVDSPFKIQKYIDNRVLKLKQKTWKKILSYNEMWEPLFTFEDFYNTENMIFKWKHKSTGEIVEKRYYYECPAEPNRTSIEKFIQETLNECGVEYKQHTRCELDGNMEIDFYVPSMRIGIEPGGLYYHSEHMVKSKDYHLNKLNSAIKHNIKLIQIFEDEIVNHPDIVRNRLLNLLGQQKYKIYARKCEIREIDSKLKSKFLNKYHIQGNDSSQIKLGAFYKNRLIAVMTFGNQRKIMSGIKKENSYELYRYCTIAGFRCVGVASKLFTYFIRNYNPEYVKTFADLRWGNGDFYIKLGFKYSHNSRPNYWYCKQFNRLHRSNFQKHMLKDKLQKFDEKLSECENMRMNNYLRIWDCGNAVYEWVKNK